VRTALRLTTDRWDEGEVKPLIKAAKLDLEMAGVVRIDEDNHLIGRAIVLYVKAHFGNIEGAERFQDAYVSLKSHLALSSDYNREEPADVDAGGTGNGSI